MSSAKPGGDVAALNREQQKSDIDTSNIGSGIADYTKSMFDQIAGQNQVPDDSDSGVRGTDNISPDDAPVIKLS